jgi:hypothetical protein
MRRETRPDLVRQALKARFGSPSPPDPDSLDPRQLTLAVAVNVMGFSFLGGHDDYLNAALGADAKPPAPWVHWSEEGGTLLLNTPGRENEPFQPFEDIRAAWEVVGELKRRGFDVAVKVRNSARPQWECHVESDTEEWKGWGMTAQEAICRASVKVLSPKEEDAGDDAPDE